MGNCVYLYQAQDNIIFQYRPLSKDYEFESAEIFEERFYNVDAGIHLNALYFPAKTDEKQGVVICYHGRGTNLSKNWGKTARIYTERGFDFIIYDYRGFGKSNGSIDVANLYSDPLKMYDIIKPEYANKKIIVLGRSLGTSLATYVASHRQADMLILEAPFYSMLDMACLTKPYIPKIVIETILKYPMKTNQFIKKVDCPVLIFHGTKDSIVPYCESVRLFDLIKHRPQNQFVALEGADHGNFMQNSLYESKIDSFIKDHQD
jgi:hypothetical protein